MTEETPPKRRGGNPRIAEIGLAYRFVKGQPQPQVARARALKRRRQLAARQKELAATRSKTLLDLLKERLLDPRLTPASLAMISREIREWQDREGRQQASPDIFAEIRAEALANEAAAAKAAKQAARKATQAAQAPAATQAPAAPQAAVEAPRASYAAAASRADNSHQESS